MGTLLQECRPHGSDGWSHRKWKKIDRGAVAVAYRLESTSVARVRLEACRVAHSSFVYDECEIVRSLDTEAQYLYYKSFMQSP